VEDFQADPDAQDLEAPLGDNLYSFDLDRSFDAERN